MSVEKFNTVIKIINGITVSSSDLAIVSQSSYTTDAESVIVVKDVEQCDIILDEKTTDHITIKSMTNVTIKSDKLIDDEYNQIETARGASVELRFIGQGWYIMSSDGLKNS